MKLSSYCINSVMDFDRILVILLILLSSFSCQDTVKSESKTDKSNEESIPFNETKWKANDGEEYPYRESMLEDLVYNEEFRRLTGDELIDLLGQPDYYREDSSYLHYRIMENKMGYITLKAKTLVIKLSEDNGIEWMKIHE